ncbi:hypothetical protein [Clostridium botulinum]|uniref:hypothetical protein n=1 Tax=Clostridium botulinum TaxID=1491 RepID=UPI0004D6BF35|nr:hypothetical protein [Clostridium botulinum]KEH90607.1 hypothetical protein Z963_11900 [Clostridium botulinum C/D str. It1]
MVKQAKIKGIKYLGKEDVYNMEVENHHNFSVNGGLIVHNCMDALRYFVYTVLRYDIEEGYDDSLYNKGKGIVARNTTTDPYGRKGGTVF